MKKPLFIDDQNFSSEEYFFVDKTELSHSFPLHRHSFVELEYIKEGKGENIVCGKKYKFTKGCLSLLMPWHVHEIIEEEPFEIYKVSFRIDTIQKSSSLIKSINEIILTSGDYQPVVSLNVEQQERFEELFNYLFIDNKKNNKYRYESMTSLITQLIIIFLGNSNECNDEINVWDILKYIQTEFNEPDISLEKVSSLFSISKSTIHEKLKEHIGLSFTELLRETRIRNACYLLTYTDSNIQDIGLYIGYSSRSAFYDAFTYVKGMSPKEYRNNNKKVLNQNQSMFYSHTYSKIFYYIHKHYKETISLEDVANEFHYNKTYLSRLLSNDGRTFADMLNEIRIYNACKELLLSNDNIDTIGFNVGFKSSETFYRTFKKYRGSTPKEYREKYKAKICEIDDIDVN